MPMQGRGSRGLRELKKSKQRADLLSIAAQLFRIKGYESTRIEDIAARADVSEKTIYNYFATKEKILIQLLTDDREKLTVAYEEVVRKPAQDLALALARLMHADLGDVRSAEDKKLWRELLAAETRAHYRVEDEFESNRKTFMHYIRTMLVSFQKRGVLSKSLSLAVAVDMIYAIHTHDFLQFCARSSATQEDVLRMAHKQMTLLLAPWLAEDE